MSLGAILPALFFYGFLGSYFTHSIWFSLGVLGALNWILVPPVLRIEETALTQFTSVEQLAELQTEVAFVVTAAVTLGIVLAIIVVWAFQLAPLLTVELWFVRLSDLDRLVWIGTTSSARFMLGLVAVFVAVFFLTGAVFVGLLWHAASVVIGILLLIVGGGIILATLALSYGSASRPSEWLDFGYSFAFILLVLTPLWYRVASIFYTIPGWIFQIALLINVAIITLLAWRFFSRTALDLRDAFAGDPRFALTDIRFSRQLQRWLAFYVPTALVCLVGWIVDTQTAATSLINIWPVLTALAASTFILALVILGVGVFNWNRVDGGSEWYKLAPKRPTQQQQQQHPVSIGPPSTAGATMQTALTASMAQYRSSYQTGPAAVETGLSEPDVEIHDQSFRILPSQKTDRGKKGKGKSN